MSRRERAAISTSRRRAASGRCHRRRAARRAHRDDQPAATHDLVEGVGRRRLRKAAPCSRPPAGPSRRVVRLQWFPPVLTRSELPGGTAANFGRCGHLRHTALRALVRRALSGEEFRCAKQSNSSILSSARVSRGVSKDNGAAGERRLRAHTSCRGAILVAADRPAVALVSQHGFENCASSGSRALESVAGGLSSRCGRHA